MISPGFKQVPQLKTELTFAKEEAYKTMSWQAYQSPSAETKGVGGSK